MDAKPHRRVHKVRRRAKRPPPESNRLPPDRAQLGPQGRTSENFEVDVAPDRIDAGAPEIRNRDESVCGTPPDEP
jgi:hypothetical protein